jgi:hypothetical protein
MLKKCFLFIKRYSLQGLCTIIWCYSLAHKDNPIKLFVKLIFIESFLNYEYFWIAFKRSSLQKIDSKDVNN